MTESRRATALLHEHGMQALRYLGTLLGDVIDGFGFYHLLHQRLRRLAAEYAHLLSDDEIARASTLARRHRIAAWISCSTFVAIILIAAVLAAFGVIEPSG